MNICFIGFYGEETVDGVSTSAFALARELVRQGDTVWFYSRGPKTETYTDAWGIRHRRFQGDKMKFDLPGALVRIIQDNTDQVDIFHLHSVFIPFNARMAQVLNRYRRPYVITPNGGYNEHILRRNPLKKAIYRLLFENSLVKNASGAVCVAEPEVRDLRNMGFQGPLGLVPNPVDVPEEESGITISPAGSLRMLYLGRYDIEHKGLDHLLAIFAEVVKQLPDARLDLYGRGPDETVLRQQASARPEGSVTFHGPVFGPPKWQAFRDCSLYIQTSRWEAFGVSIGEAMLMSRPVALSKGCYLSGLLSQNHAGLVLEEAASRAAEQIVKAHSTTDWVISQGSLCRQIAQREFVVSHVANKLRSFYESVLPAPKPESRGHEAPVSSSH